MIEETLYLRCRLGDVAPLALLTGDPARVERVVELLDAPHPISRNREFSVVTGQYHGVPVTIASGGIGAPSTAIAMEELALLGVRAVVRVGTMMGVEAPLGSVVLSTGAARFEGTSPRYLPMNYPAVPDWSLVRRLETAGQAHGLDLRLGLTATYDAFYPDMAPSLLREMTPLDLAESSRAGILSLDMETSLVFVLGGLRRLAVAAMCLVTVQAEPHYHMDPDRRIELDHRLTLAALDGLIEFGRSRVRNGEDTVNKR